MIDPELKTQLDQLNQNLAEIKKKTGGGGIWRSFFNGMLSALGYVVGLALIVVILGWVLNQLGLLQQFEAEVKNFTNLVNAAQKLITPQDNSMKSTNQPAGYPDTVTLPNGQQYHINISQ